MKSMVSKWKQTLLVLMQVVVLMALILHTNVPVEAHESDHAICCHTAQSGCSILSSSLLTIAIWDLQTDSETSTFLYEQTILLPLDPPPKVRHVHSALS